MKTEREIREMLQILKAFGHPEAVKAIEWVLGIYQADGERKDGGE
jgi:hypothetical protein